MDDQHYLVSALKDLAIELGKTPTRAEFGVRVKGADYKLLKCFGTYSQLLQAAGLETYGERRSRTPELKKYDKQVLKHETRMDVRAKFNEEIAPYVGRWERDPKQTATLMIRGDDHGEWLDPFCDDVFWDVARRLQPDYLIFNGDNVDFWEVSVHDHDPTRQADIQREIDFVVENLFKKARQTCPNAQIDWVLGNHELRLFKYLCNQAPMLAKLRCLQFQSLFELEAHRINLVARESFLSPGGGRDTENFKVYCDVLAVLHGTKLGKHPAMKELEKYGKNGISNHVHRMSYFFNRNLYGHHKWVSNRAMCQLKSGKEYIPDLVEWEQGFVIAHIDKGRVDLETPDLTDGFACIGGKYYHK